MEDKRGIDVTEAYKTIMVDPSQINNMSVDTLKAIASLIRKQENLDSGKSNSQEKGISLNLVSPYYKGEENKSENIFNKRIDGFAGSIILSSITLIFGLIFMLIIFNY